MNEDVVLDQLRSHLAYWTHQETVAQFQKQNLLQQILETRREILLLDILNKE